MAISAVRISGPRSQGAIIRQLLASDYRIIRIMDHISLYQIRDFNYSKPKDRSEILYYSKPKDMDEAYSHSHSHNNNNNSSKQSKA